MKRIIGSAFMLAGAACLYCFAAGGTFHGREIPGSPFGIPFLSLGKHYPIDAVLMLGALWGFLIGLALVVSGPGGASVPAASAAAGSVAARYAAATSHKGGTIARFLLLNGLLLISTLFVAYIGGKSRQDAMIVGVFGLVAFAQMGLGIILAILALFERPKGIISLILGIPIQLFGMIIGLLAFFVWGRG